jgi:hypothetical protein
LRRRHHRRLEHAAQLAAGYFGTRHLEHADAGHDDDSGTGHHEQPGAWYVERAWFGIDEYAERERKCSSRNSVPGGNRFGPILRSAEPIPESGARHDISVTHHHV